MEIGFLNCNLKVTRGGIGPAGVILFGILFQKKKRLFDFLQKKRFFSLLSFVNRKGVSRLLKLQSSNHYNTTEQH